MKKNLLIILAGALLFFLAKDIHAQMKRITISEEVKATIKVSEDLKTRLKENVKASLANTGKFEVIERSPADLKMLFEEQKFSSHRTGKVENHHAIKAEAGMISGVAYIIQLTVNNSSEWNEKGSRYRAYDNKNVYYKTVGANVRVLDSSTGRIVFDKNIAATSYLTGSGGEKLLHAAYRNLSGKIADSLVEEFYPIRIMERTGEEVSINRGSSHGIKKGTLLETFAVKKVTDKDTMKDADVTYSVGKIRVIDISQNTARAKIINDMGVTVDCIAKILHEKPKEAEDPVKKMESEQDW